MTSRSYEELSAAVAVAARKSDTQELRYLSEELLAMSTSESEALAYRALGQSAYIESDFSLALRHYQRAHAGYLSLDDQAGIAATLGNIGSASYFLGRPNEALTAHNEALAIHLQRNDMNGVARASNSIGLVHKDAGRFDEALEWYTKALGHYHSCGDDRGTAMAFCNIGAVYNATAAYVEALSYYYRALSIYELNGDTFGLAAVYGNIGNIHSSMGNSTEACAYFHRSLELHTTNGTRNGQANVMSNLGNTLHASGDNTSAIEWLNKSLDVYREIGDHAVLADITANLLLILIDDENYTEAAVVVEDLRTFVITEPSTAIRYHIGQALLAVEAQHHHEARTLLLDALNLAAEHQLRKEEATILLHLRDLSQKQGDFPGYIDFNERYTRLAEEISGRDISVKLAMAEKQREIDAREKEHEKHMAVLHSTLPKHIADRVARGEVVNDQFDNASVLFLDVVGFTTHSSELDATIVVELLQNIFTSFDSICANNDVTKIKTIGDSYMAVAFQIANSEQRIANQIAKVMPSVVEAQQIANSEQRIANVARAMMASEFMWPYTGERVRFRIGIHCGPVVAGVLGTERMQYDVWGDTVNVASRMESSSEPGRIHISEALAKALNEHKNSPPDPLSHASLERGSHTVVPRGEVDVKGKGTMKTYWLE
ncbi:MAG: tetratricopeptide repeat protein [Ignavibacteria bacterium]|nr:tetratricopeptide repeat protein [Ignavibacteria bacterium]